MMDTMTAVKIMIMVMTVIVDVVMEIVIINYKSNMEDYGFRRIYIYPRDRASVGRKQKKK